MPAPSRDFRQGRQRGGLGRLGQDSMLVEISWEGEVPGGLTGVRLGWAGAGLWR